MKIIMENWRGYIEEQEGNEPTVEDFIQAMAKAHPKVMQKVLGVAPKVIASIAAGALAASVAGPAGAAVAGTAVSAGAGALAGRGVELVSGEVVTQIMNKFSSKSANLSKWMINRLRKGVPDSERLPIDKYFDLDDDIASLVKGGGKTSPLFEKFISELFAEFQVKLDKMDGTEDLNMPLKDFLDGTANEYLNKLMKDGELGGLYKSLKVDKV